MVADSMNVYRPVLANGVKLYSLNVTDDAPGTISNAKASPSEMVRVNVVIDRVVPSAQMA